MTGKKKDMNGGRNDEEYALKMLKELDENYALLTKADQGMLNKMLIWSRLQNFFKLLENILRNHLLSSVYQNINVRVQKLLELWEKFTKIKEIKNSGSSEIVKLFQANIIFISEEVKNILITSFESIIRRLFDKSQRHIYNRIDIKLNELETIEKQIDFFIGLFNLLNTFGNRRNSANFKLLEQSFNILMEQYLIYLDHLNKYSSYLPNSSTVRNILSKRKLNLLNKYNNKIQKLKSQLLPQVESQQLQQVESQQLNKNVIKNVLTRLKNTLKTQLNKNQRKIKLASLEKFKKKIANSQLLQDPEIIRLLKEIENTNQSNISAKIISLTEYNKAQKNKNYNKILSNLQIKYRNQSNFAKLSKLAKIGSTFDSISRMKNSNNKNILLQALRETIKQSKNSLTVYPEFQEYEKLIIPPQ